MTHFLSTLPMLLAMSAAGMLHCAGMCGGLAIVAAGPGRSGLALYLSGKTAAYLLLGALAGSLGEMVMRSAPFGWGARALAVLTGVVLLVLALEALGLVRLAPSQSGWLGAVSRSLSRLAAEEGWQGNLVLGFANGWLPCPLTYAFVALAAATGSPLWGAATLLVLSLASAVPLSACALAGRRLGRRLPVFLGVVMLAMAAVTFYRALVSGGAHHHMH
ncbi:MAG: sulfite exporter TauE/SafE family protein [Bryobacterales bacterium]|nr:sulfite exporter TauE/SafE family protein [Bryobacterales bacterium]